MNRRLFIYTTIATLSGCQSMPMVLDTGAQISKSLGYNPVQLANVVKELLNLSVSRASQALSQTGAYDDKNLMNLVLPAELQQMSELMTKMGLNKVVDNIQAKLNRGAELAAKEAGIVFNDAVKGLTVLNAIDIIRGGDGAATAYFRANTETTLRNRYSNILQEKLSSVGFYREYKSFLISYKMLPLPNKPDLDIENKALTLGIDTLFKQIAIEENKIRANPTEQGSLLLTSVLGKMG